MRQKKSNHKLITLQNRKKIQVYLLIAIGFISFITSSCEKENTPEKENTTITKDPIITWSNTSNIEMVYIKGGSFIMGSPINEKDRDSNETQHKVTLSDFRMSKFEITNAQFAAFLNAKNIDSTGKYPEGNYPDMVLVHETIENHKRGIHYNTNKWEPFEDFENHPIINVTWYGAVEFATYEGGTIPTEAQWEYACRAGTTTPFNTGDFLTYLQANYDWSEPYNGGTNALTHSPDHTQTVGMYPSNAWGLYDMHGNVLEWCSDWYSTYPTTEQTDPTGATLSTYRVIRGGCFASTASGCRSSLRFPIKPLRVYENVGFRIVLTP